MSEHPPINTSVTEEELHAFIDGELPPERARMVGAMIQADAALSARVNAFRADKEMMKRIYGPLVDRPVPEHLLRLAQSGARPARLGWRRLAVAASVLFLVVVGGLWLRPPGSDDVVELALDARSAPIASVSDDLSPYNEALSRIVEAKVKVPDLRRAGYTLAGLQIEQDAATISYRDGAGKLFTIYLRQSDGSVRFDQFKRADLRICVWQDDRLSMVMAGEMSAAVMQKLASMAYVGLTA